MMKFNRLALTLTFLLPFGMAASKLAQAHVWMSETQVVKSDNSSCEVNSAVLDALTQEFRANGERIFVITRLGRGETSATLNRARLEHAGFYLLNQRSLDPARVTFAVGERVKEEGRLEFYLGSRLALVSLAKRGKVACLTCCADYIEPSIKGQGKKGRR